MSELDKTGKKLIDSIRMTKEGPATAAVKSAAEKKASGKTSNKQKSPVASTSKPTASTTKEKIMTRDAPKASKKPKSSANRKKQHRKKTVTFTDIPYQDGSQVWPD